MRIAAAFVFAVWLAGAVAALIAGLWWIGLLTFLFMGGPALLYLLPPARERMTGPRNFITFSTTLPGFVGPEEDEHGELLPDGAPALSALGELLRAGGHQVGTLHRHSHYGWGIDVDRAEVIIQGPADELLLIVDDGKRIETLAAVMDALRGDARFSAVEQMTPGEFSERERAAALAEGRGARRLVSRS